MDDLLNRLRTVDPPGGNEHSTRWHRNPDGPKAADRIETLEAEVERLRDKLWQRNMELSWDPEYVTQVERLQARKRELEAALQALVAVSTTPDERQRPYQWNEAWDAARAALARFGPWSETDDQVEVEP